MVLKNSIDWDCLSVELQERINDHVTSSDFATKVVRTDIAQSLSLAAQNQALENIGADLMVIDLVNGQAVLTEDQSLTDTQKSTARSNIGVQSADELLEDADFIAQLKTKLGIA